MTISRVSNASFSSTIASTTLTITLPASLQANDYIAVLVGNGEDSPVPSITGGTITSNYSALGALGFRDYGTAGISTHFYYKLHSGSESNPTITWNTGNSTGGGIWALAVGYRTTVGWHATSPVALNPAYGVSTTSSSSPNPPQGVGTIELAYNNTFVAHFLQSSDNNTQTLSTANGWSTPSGSNTTSGSDGSIYVTEQYFLNSGVVNSPVWSLSLGPDYYSWRFVEFREREVIGYWAENLIRVKA